MDRQGKAQIENGGVLAVHYLLGGRLNQIHLAPIRWQGSTRRVNMALHFLPKTIVLVAFSRAFAEGSAAPLFVAKKETDSASCPTWHPEKKWSTFVRSSVGMPFVRGHRGASEDKTTSVVLLPPGTRTGRDLGGNPTVPLAAQPPKSGNGSSYHDHHTRGRKTGIHAQSAPFCTSKGLLIT